jgi:purine-binding chemotaxis protein CheW
MSTEVMTRQSGGQEIEAMDHNVRAAMDGGHGTTQLVTVKVGPQLFGIPVLDIEDIIGPQNVTFIPRASRMIQGALNLRGRIVTAIDMRRRLGLSETTDDKHRMNVVVERNGDLYSLVVDEVGEVLTLEDHAREAHPPTMRSAVRDVSTGIHRLDGDLMVVLDVGKILEF